MCSRGNLKSHKVQYLQGSLRAQAACTWVPLGMHRDLFHLESVINMETSENITQKSAFPAEVSQEKPPEPPFLCGNNQWKQRAAARADPEQAPRSPQVHLPHYMHSHDLSETLSQSTSTSPSFHKRETEAQERNLSKVTQPVSGRGG